MTTTVLAADAVRSTGAARPVSATRAARAGGAEGDSAAHPRTLAYRALLAEGTTHGRDGWTRTAPQAGVPPKPVRSGAGKLWRFPEVPAADTAALPSPTDALSSTDRPE
jgi:hypothetical protein